MADLTTEYFWHCATAESWSQGIGGIPSSKGFVIGSGGDPDL